MAYELTPLALPNIIGALLTFLMLYLLLLFTPHKRVMRVLAIYVYFAAVTSLSWAMMTLSADGRTRLFWAVLNSLFMATLFPLQIHFLLLYMGRARWLVERVWPPSMIYLPLFVHVALVGQPEAFKLFFLFWIVALAAVVALSIQALSRDKNPLSRTQKWLMISFLLVPFVWLIIYTFAAPLIAADVTWISGYFIAFSSGIAIYAMLRYHVLNTEILLRSGLVIFVTSIVLGSAVYSLLIITSALFGLRLPREASLFTLCAVVVAAWFFKPMYDAGTRLVEWLAPDLKWRECRLEQIFLMDYNGIRVSSASRAGTPMDEDLAGGMLTAIQQFILHTFHSEGRDNVRTISLGKYRILVEHAPPIYIALVFTGHETPALRREVRRVLCKILERHGERLKHWDGNHEGMEDVDRMLEALVARAGGWALEGRGEAAKEPQGP
ncbi:MAG: hypothetical protein ACUVV6_07135 [Thermoplasmatota archaeon]